MHHDHMDVRALGVVRRCLLALPAILVLLTAALFTPIDWSWNFLPWLMATGFSLFVLLAGLRPRRRASSHDFALGSVGLLFASLWMPSFAPIWVLLLVVPASIASFILSGFFSLWRMRPEVGIPQPSQNVRQAVKVALDECVIGYFAKTVEVPRGKRLERIVQEARGALAYFELQGWLDNPASFHIAPPLPTDAQRTTKSAGKLQYDVLRFASAYRPPQSAPGARRWEEKRQSPVVHVRLLEHPGAPRPWLFCIHGYRMGSRWLDFRLFPPGWLYHKLGFNIAMPVLPLHGPRKAGWRSGDGYLDGDLIDIVYTQAQAQSDLRQTIRWLREVAGAERIGIFGYSLGGYNASLLSALEPGLESVIATIPLVDIATVLWNHGPRSLLAHIRKSGIGPQDVRRLLRVVSPLTISSQVPKERRFILAGCADRIVPLPPTLDLWHHWDQPTLEWFDGTHLSVREEPSVPPAIESFLRQAGLLLR